MKIYKNRHDNETSRVEKELSKYSGFITIATGSEKYHKMAYTLMISYKLTSENPYRFAVITDKETTYTDCFDDVIVIEDATKTYMDKVALLINSPYRETIFIDADCIAFNDLNKYWDYFKNASDFSGFGRILPLDAKDGWFNKDNLGKYKDKISNILDVHGGIYFIRKGDICNQMYNISQDIVRNYNEYSFRRFKKPADEPILALAMALTKCLPVKSKSNNYAWLRRTSNIKADFFSKKLNYRFDNTDTEDGMLMHFGSSRTIAPLYLIESKKVHFMNEYGRKWNKGEMVKNYIQCYVKAFLNCISYFWKKVLKSINI